MWQGHVLYNYIQLEKMSCDIKIIILRICMWQGHVLYNYIQLEKMCPKCHVTLKLSY